MKILATKHLNILAFSEFGVGLVFTPGWSLYLLIGFISVNIFWD